MKTKTPLFCGAICTESDAARPQRSPRSGYAAALLALCAALSGCSDLIPGLNVRMDSGSPPDCSGAAAQSATDCPGSHAAFSYDVVELNPESLVAISQQKPADPTDALPGELPSDVAPEYRIGPGDIIYVTVWDHPELTTPYTSAINDPSVPAIEGRMVASDGTVFYPYIGAFKVANMTAAELRDDLIGQLDKVLTHPQIDVRVVSFKAHRVEVTGEVAKPGTIYLDNTPKGVLEALDLCGGLTPAGSRRRLILERAGTRYRIDLAALLSGDQPAVNPLLQPGDVIHVPDQSGDQVFVLGAVTKQQPLTIEQDSMSLIQALTQAGGLDALAGKQSGVFVFRSHNVDTHTRTQVYVLDLSHPQGMLLAGAFKLQPRDVVYVQATDFSQYNALINELLPTVTTIYELNAIHQFIQ
jgi:polysaccharide export outer membrane protein